MSGEAARCAFCHDDFVASDERAACAECKTVLHWDCRALLGRCPTMGCKDASFRIGGRPVRERPGFRAALERHFSRMPLPPLEEREGECASCGDRFFFAPAAICPKCNARIHMSCWAFLREQCPVCETPPRALSGSDEPEPAADGCQYCSRASSLAPLWECPTCGALAHVLCLAAHVGTCPNEACGTTSKKQAPAPPRDPADFRSALERLKNRKKRD